MKQNEKSTCWNTERSVEVFKFPQFYKWDATPINSTKLRKTIDYQQNAQSKLISFYEASEIGPLLLKPNTILYVISIRLVAADKMGCFKFFHISSTPI